MSIGRLLGSGKRWKQEYYVAMSAGPSGKTELSREKSTAAGSRDSRYDRVALPGTTRHWAQEAEQACGRLERSPSLRRGMRWRVNGLSCAGRRPSLGRLATDGTHASDEKTASLGNGWQGAHRAGNAHADRSSKCQTG